MAGTIQHLFIKTCHGAPMAPQTFLNVRRGFGILDDVNAHPMSPRQILIAREEDLADLQIAPGSIRENIVVSELSADAFRPGAVVEIDGLVRIRLLFHCEPCKRIAHVVPDLRSIVNRRGIVGTILEGGLVSLGAQVQIEEQRFPELSSVPYYRFLSFVSLIPPGKVVTYKEVVIGMGVADSYYRAIPAYIQRTDEGQYPCHRILDTNGQTLSFLPHQAEKLAAEGISTTVKISMFDETTVANIPLHLYLWKDASLYLM